MNNGQLGISVIITAGTVAIIGSILIAVGKRKDKRKLLIYGSGFIVATGVYLFIVWAELREILTALAAVAAVFIAAFSIDQSRQIRQDSIDRESRDRKERLLNEVTKWLRELEGRIFPKITPITLGTEDTLRRISISPEIPQDTWLALEDLDRALGEKNALAEGIKEAEYYQKLTLKLDKELSSLIGVTANNLKQREQLDVGKAELPSDKKESQLIKELIENDDRPLEGLGLSDQGIAWVRLARNTHAIKKSIFSAVDRAIELKTNLIEVG